MFIRWVHCETLVATLMAYQHTHNIEHYKSFKRIFDYTFEKVGLYPENKHKVKINFFTKPIAV